MGNQKMKLPHKDENATKKLKVVILEVKLEPDINGVVGGIAGCENVDRASALKRL